MGDEDTAGPGRAGLAGTVVEPLDVRVPQRVLDDLRDRLRRTRWSEQVLGSGWERGVPLDALRPLVQRWADAYDWRATEDRVRAAGEWTTVVDGQRLHLLHVRSAEPGALPLLLTHGWPGGVVDLLPVLGPLTDPARHGGDPADAFHVVAPSVPGAGRSTPLTPGWDHQRVARAWVELMTRLGYDRFGAAGGDTGSVVSPLVGALAPDRVVGVHLHGNLDVPDPVGPLGAAEAERLAWARRRAAADGGYAALQATRPHTLGHALSDSPVGQLAWILDKVHDWSDPARPPFGDVDPGDVLDLATWTWVTGTSATAANLYLENRRAGAHPPVRSAVPTGVALFPTDPMLRSVAERRHTLVHWTEHPRGSHFATLDAPDLLVTDLRAFYRSVRD
ncbi:epoxide hydrolase [Cellulomonas sp. zg-ZUI199]|uniref:Epoxide hydrolase n=1 Tax=Cellulomonas wangleii TaxID=2816956 RepID=A0ABX8D4T0_9CELL|nr:epoxide hydrolase family protein [Cellulomonas wangleii]MBO0924440.1 epoxide hydrolase [Cellulomonas wangleii]QVI62434.1 epoxide hydrolase [Cellulomonas wangleii]